MVAERGSETQQSSLAMSGVGDAVTAVDAAQVPLPSPAWPEDESTAPQQLLLNMEVFAMQFVRLQQEVVGLRTKLEAQESFEAEVKRLKEHMSVYAEKKDDGMPKFNVKMVDRPEKFSGEGWIEWENSFVSFLKRSDMRWKAILKEIAKKSDKPLDEDAMPDIWNIVGIQKEEVYDEFQEQLYDYLKTYTSGVINTTVIADGPTKSFESWRRLCDQGRSIRTRPLRDEKRALYHPKQATMDTLIKGIADWEKKYAAYVNQCPHDSIGESERIMCLEDMCPEPVQRYFSEKAQVNGIKTYAEYKDAIDQYFYEEKRWTKGTKPKLNVCFEHQEEHNEDNNEHKTGEPTECDEDWAS